MTSTNQAGLHEVDWSKLLAPEDTGEANHLIGMKLPSIALPATSGENVDLSRLTGRTVIFAYPMTGRPDVALPNNWDMIPGARGCTPQACAFRDLRDELKEAGVGSVFGLSTQNNEYQLEAATRLHLPFPLLSDASGSLRVALNLPSMDVEGETLLRRITLIIDNATIVKVFYPVFPPDENARLVLDWTRSN